MKTEEMPVSEISLHESELLDLAFNAVNRVSKYYTERNDPKQFQANQALHIILNINNLEHMSNHQSQLERDLEK